MPSAVKLNKGGTGESSGSVRLGSLSSSKKLWATASIGVILSDGSYWRNCEINSIASSGARFRKTFNYQKEKGEVAKAINKTQSRLKLTPFVASNPL